MSESDQKFRAARGKLAAIRDRFTRQKSTVPHCRADGLIRWSTAAVVTCVAGVAAIQSYSHIYELARTHGQSVLDARMLPLSVDLLIVAASLVMFHPSAPKRARLMLWLGIAATVGANIADGARSGVLGAVISAWPAVAFIGSVEMLIGLVRAARPAAVPGVPDAYPEAVQAFAAEIEAGTPPAHRAIRDRLSVGASTAQKIRTYLEDIIRTRALEGATS